MTNSTLFAVAILFFVIFTIREWLLILSNHPIFVTVCIILVAVYAFNDAGSVLKTFFKIAGTVLVTLIIVCFVAAISTMEEE